MSGVLLQLMYIIAFLGGHAMILYKTTNLFCGRVSRSAGVLLPGFRLGGQNATTVFFLRLNLKPDDPQKCCTKLQWLLIKIEKFLLCLPALSRFITLPLHRKVSMSHPLPYFLNQLESLPVHPRCSGSPAYRLTKMADPPSPPPPKITKNNQKQQQQ